MPPETQTDQSGVTRTTDGTIANQASSQQTSSSTETTTSTEAKPTETTETKATETKSTDKSIASAADKKDAKDAKPEGAPEKYEAYKLPDGLELDPAAVEAANKLFKELNLPQAAAQKIVDQHIALMQKAQNEPIDFFNQQKADWRKELIADKSLGNGKDNLSDATLKNVSNALNSLPEALRESFKEAMDYTGAGDHPAFVRALNAFGEALGEGTHVSGKGPSPLGQSPSGQGSRPTPAQALFPNLPSATSGR